MYSAVITVMYEKIFISCHMINTSVGFTLKHATSLPDDHVNSCFKYETERSVVPAHMISCTNGMKPFFRGNLNMLRHVNSCFAQKTTLICNLITRPTLDELQSFTQVQCERCKNIERITGTFWHQHEKKSHKEREPNIIIYTWRKHNGIHVLELYVPLHECKKDLLQIKGLH